MKDLFLTVTFITCYIFYMDIIDLITNISEREI